MPHHTHRAATTQQQRSTMHIPATNAFAISTTSSSSNSSRLWPSQRSQHQRLQRPPTQRHRQRCAAHNSAEHNSSRSQEQEQDQHPQIPQHPQQQPTQPPSRRQQQTQDADAGTTRAPQSNTPPTSNGSTRRSPSSGNTSSPFSIEDPQLLVGDCVALVAAALYRQIAAIVLSPSFPGWFAPISVNPNRLAEFVNFASMLVASWVVAATLTGGYSGVAVGAGVPGALRSVCKAWLVAMPICAAHLVLVTASESQALVGAEGFADALPLAASGPGEPLGTAAALLGLMAMWRSLYAVHFDSWVWASARDVAEDAARFREALASVALVAAGCSILLQVLQLTATISAASADGVSLDQLLFG